VTQSGHSTTVDRGSSTASAKNGKSSHLDPAPFSESGGRVATERRATRRPKRGACGLVAWARDGVARVASIFSSRSLEDHPLFSDFPSPKSSALSRFWGQPGIGLGRPCKAIIWSI